MSLYSSLTQVLAPFAAKINGLLTGWDGTRYSTPGEAVREQINDLHVLIGDVPGTAIQASAVAYNDSDVGTELTNVNGRLQQYERYGDTFNPTISYAGLQYGSFDTTTGETSGSSGNRMRTIDFIRMKAGDTILLDHTTYRHAVLIYSADSTESFIEAPSKINSEQVAEIKISVDCYVRVAFANYDNTELPSTHEDRIAMLDSVTIVRKGASDSVFDKFEVGSLSSTITNGGVLFNTTDYNRHRSKLYKIDGSSVVSFTFTDADSAVSDMLYVGLYSDDFAEYELLSTYVENRNNITFSVNPKYKYVAAHVTHASNVYNFHEVKISTDHIIHKAYLPNIGVSARFNSIGFNYPMYSNVMASGRLLLPPNYSVDGEKVPLIVFAHGSGGITSWSAVMATNYIDFLTYLTNEGYAVFDCFPWGNKISGTAYSPLIIPLHIRAYIDGIKYVCDRFNVDIDNVSLLCKSQGGYIGHWAYTQEQFNFKAVGLFAPGIDVGYGTDYDILFYNKNCRQALLSVENFKGTDEEKSAFVDDGKLSNSLVASFIGKNKAKFVNMLTLSCGIIGSTSMDTLWTESTVMMTSVPQWMRDEGLPELPSGADKIPSFAANRDYSKNAKCPVKFWCAFDDANTSSYGNYAMHTYINNGGGNSEFRELPIGTGGHHAMDTDANALKSSGTTRLGVTYTDIPTAYVEFVEFINQYCV